MNNLRIYKDEKRDWDKNAEFYKIEKNLLFRKRVLQHIKEVYQISEKEKVLDAGCGATIIPDNYIGIDFSKEMIKKARDLNPKGKYCVGEIQNLPFEGNYFDAIICNGLFHHLKIQGLYEKSIKELDRVLKPGGKMCIFDRQEAILADIFHRIRRPIRNLFFRYFSQCGTSHEGDYTNKDLQKIVDLGYETEEIKSVVSLLFQSLLIVNNIILYLCGYKMMNIVQRILFQIGSFFEKHLRFKFLCAEQCIRLRKKWPGKREKKKGLNSSSSKNL